MGPKWGSGERSGEGKWGNDAIIARRLPEESGYFVFKGVVFPSRKRSRSLNISLSLIYIPPLVQERFAHTQLNRTHNILKRNTRSKNQNLDNKRIARRNEKKSHR